MRQTNSSTLVQPSPSPPPPPPTMFSRVSTLYWWKERGAGKQRILKLVTVVFLNSVLKTSKIGAITQVSQGILSTIVEYSQGGGTEQTVLVRECDCLMRLRSETR